MHHLMNAKLNSIRPILNEDPSTSPQVTNLWISALTCPLQVDHSGRRRSGPRSSRRCLRRRRRRFRRRRWPSQRSPRIRRRRSRPHRIWGNESDGNAVHIGHNDTVPVTVIWTNGSPISHLTVSSTVDDSEANITGIPFNKESGNLNDF